MPLAAMQGVFLLSGFVPTVVCHRLLLLIQSAGGCTHFPLSIFSFLQNQRSTQRGLFFINATYAEHMRAQRYGHRYAFAARNSVLMPCSRSIDKQRIKVYYMGTTLMFNL